MTRRIFLLWSFLIWAPFLAAPVLAQGFPDTEIIEAAKSGTIADARAALLQGQSVNSRSRGGDPAIVMAAQHGNLSVLKFLLEKGAKPDLYDRRTGKTALVAAAEIGAPAMIAVLLSYEADANLADRQGETPLMKAARSGSLESVRLLLEAGADVNATDYAGHTALWHARDARKRRIVDRLEQGSNR